MKINGNTPEKPTADRGAILVVGGPKGQDLDREELLIKWGDKYRMMSLNSTHNRVEGRYYWDYVFVNHSHISDHMGTDVNWLMPGESCVIGYDTGTVHPRVDEIIDIDPKQGSCALLGVVTAIYKGYSPVLTVGVYLDEPPFITGNIKKTWKHWFPYLDGHVKSMQDRGLIAETFGVYK